MTERLETAHSFADSLSEVELLLRLAEEAAPGGPGENEKGFAALNKSALLLMTGKFEAFLEAAAEDFVYAINEVGARSRHLPRRLLVEHSVKAVREVEKRLNNGDVEGICSLFTRLGKRWTDSETFSDLEVSCKSNYGKHGHNEVLRLFRRVGIDDVFKAVTIPHDGSEVYDGEGTSPLDVKGMINSLTGMRNYILHQDQTPALTTDNLRTQCAALKRFAVALVAALQHIVDDVEQKVLMERAAGMP